jgi:hypothetical protein
MNSDSDPLLRALTDEDPACPDGRALVALGRLIRQHSIPPGAGIAVADDVIARLSDAEQVDGAQIDACFDGGQPAADAQLARLGELVRSLAPRRVDLKDRVLARIRASTRFSAFASDSQAVFERTRRWRIWSAVVAGHCAALLAFAIFEIGFTGSPGAHSEGDAATAAERAHELSTGPGSGSAGAMPTGIPHDAGAHAFATLPPHLPPTWLDIRGLGADLFLLRRFPELREESRRHYGMEGSAAPVHAGLAWLISQQDAASGCFGAPSGNFDRDIATQSLATLALLAEGSGDPARRSAARRGLDWLARNLTADGTSRLADTSIASSGLGSLALVEGGLLLNDAAVQQQAEDCLAELDSGMPMQPGAAGLGGFVLLALETAQQGGLHVPGRLLQQSRRNIGRSLPAQENDPGRLGVAAFARFILGHRDNPSTIHQIERLGELLPTPDPSGRVDPLAWFFATLAMREAGGASWERWSAALQHSLLPLLVSDAGGTAHVEANKIRYGESAGAVFATSVTLLDLQAPYRYLPLARP